MQYYIYKITNKLNGKIYIGQHKVPLIHETFYRYMGKGIAITEAIKKYGKENFEKEIIEYIDDDEKHQYVSEREIYWISYYNSTAPNGYNISPGGEGGTTSEIAKRSAKTRKQNGYKFSNETKQKISLATKNKSKSEIHKKHLSDHHRLRCVKTIIFEDGSMPIETYMSIENIAKIFNIKTTSILRRASETNRFCNGIKIKELKKTDKKENQLKHKHGLYKDPVKNDIVPYYTFRNRKTSSFKKDNTPLNPYFYIKCEDYFIGYTN